MKTPFVALLAVGAGFAAAYWFRAPSQADSPATTRVPAPAAPIAAPAGEGVGSARPASAPDTRKLEVDESKDAPVRTASADGSKSRQFAFAELKRLRGVETELDYKPFLDRLAPDKAAAVRALLLSKLDVLDLVREEAAHGATREEQNAKATAFLRQADDQLRLALGEEDFQGLADFTRALPYVKAAERLGERFFVGNAPITEEQKNSLLQALITAPKPGSINDVLAGKVSRKDFLDTVNGANQMFCAQAAQFLSPRQQEILQAHEQQELTSVASRLDMAMLRASSSRTPPVPH